MKLNLIGDIAGRYDELMELLKKMPEADKIILLGDLNDRGKDSKKVIEWAMSTPNVEAIKGNHCQMMVDACRNSERDPSWLHNDIWLYNGGWPTINSYGGAIELIPKEHVDWLDNRPLYLEFDDLILSHAPILSLENLPNQYSRAYEDVGCEEGNFIWNRQEPNKPLGKFHIHGHNSSYKQFKTLPDNKVYCICLDNSTRKELRGIHWKSEDDYELFIQEYINEKNIKEK